MRPAAPAILSKTGPRSAAHSRLHPADVGVSAGGTGAFSVSWSDGVSRTAEPNEDLGAFTCP